MGTILAAVLVLMMVVDLLNMVRWWRLWGLSRLWLREVVARVLVVVVVVVTRALTVHLVTEFQVLRRRPCSLFRGGNKGAAR